MGDEKDPFETVWKKAPLLELVLRQCLSAVMHTNYQTSFVNSQIGQESGDCLASGNLDGNMLASQRHCLTSNSPSPQPGNSSQNTYSPLGNTQQAQQPAFAGPSFGSCPSPDSNGTSTPEASHNEYLDFAMIPSQWAKEASVVPRELGACFPDLAADFLHDVEKLKPPAPTPIQETTLRQSSPGPTTQNTQSPALSSQLPWSQIPIASHTPTGMPSQQPSVAAGFQQTHVLPHPSTTIQHQRVDRPGTTSHRPNTIQHTLPSPQQHGQVPHGMGTFSSPAASFPMGSHAPMVGSISSLSPQTGMNDQTLMTIARPCAQTPGSTVAVTMQRTSSGSTSLYTPSTADYHTMAAVTRPHGNFRLDAPGYHATPAPSSYALTASSNGSMPSHGSSMQYHPSTTPGDPFQFSDRSLSDPGSIDDFLSSTGTRSPFSEQGLLTRSPPPTPQQNLPCRKATRRSGRGPRNPVPKTIVLRRQLVNPNYRGPVPASLQLWEFLLHHLELKIAEDAVVWIDEKSGKFRVVNSEKIAKMWGDYRAVPAMDYEKMTRALRYYYKRNILVKLQRRLIYQFSGEVMRQIMSYRKPQYSME